MGCSRMITAADSALHLTRSPIQAEAGWGVGGCYKSFKLFGETVLCDEMHGPVDLNFCD